MKQKPIQPKGEKIMEENVVTTVVAEPAVIDIPVETVEAVNQAIAPVQVPTITIPEAKKPVVDLSAFTQKDMLVAGGLTLAGAGLAEGIRWLLTKRPITKLINDTKKVIAYAKNGVNLNQETPVQAAPQQTEIPVVQQTATTEAPATPQANQ